MGTCGPAPLVTPALAERIERDFVRHIVEGMAADGVPYRGTLFAGLMVGSDGEPRLLEINVRFGDPETQVLVNLIDGDFAEALDLAAQGKLQPGVVQLNDRHALCVVLAAAGYPGTPQRGDLISGLEQVTAEQNLRVYHAGTERAAEGWMTAGGRVLGITGLGSSLREAHARAYGAAEAVQFAGRQMRSDIGAKMLRYVGAEAE
jgi:phosphoribosylamine--glycine ligase